MEKRSTPSLQITDRFGAQTAFASLRLPDGTEATVPAEHAAAIYVNEQPAFRVVCTPALLPQLALGRLLTEGWIASADEVEQVAVCAPKRSVICKEGVLRFSIKFPCIINAMLCGKRTVSKYRFGGKKSRALLP